MTTVRRSHRSPDGLTIWGHNRTKGLPANKGAPSMPGTADRMVPIQQVSLPLSHYGSLSGVTLWLYCVYATMLLW